MALTRALCLLLLAGCPREPEEVPACDTSRERWAATTEHVTFATFTTTATSDGDIFIASGDGVILGATRLTANVLVRIHDGAVTAQTTLPAYPGLAPFQVNDDGAGIVPVFRDIDFAALVQFGPDLATRWMVPRPMFGDIAPDRRVATVTSGELDVRTLHYFDSQGAQQWQADVPAVGLRMTPTGDVYVWGRAERFLYSSSGELLEHLPVQELRGLSPTFGSDGTRVEVAGTNIFVVAPSGEEVSVDVGRPLVSNPPVVTAAGEIVAVAADAPPSLVRVAADHSVTFADVTPALSKLVYADTSGYVLEETVRFEGCRNDRTGVVSYAWP